MSKYYFAFQIFTELLIFGFIMAFFSPEILKVSLEFFKMVKINIELSKLLSIPLAYSIAFLLFFSGLFIMIVFFSAYDHVISKYHKSKV